MRPSTYDLPFDQFQRYHAVGRLLARVPVPEGRVLRVLDVGGGEGVMREFAPEGAMVVVVEPAIRFGGSVAAEGSKLPFGREAFDAVVSCDSLEHVRPAARRPFVSEMMRVARGLVVVAAPFSDPSVVAAELALHEFIRNVRGGEYPFLSEHLEHGLPDRLEVRGWLESLGGRVCELPSGYLPRWLPMMAVSFFLEEDRRFERLRPLVHRFYNTTFGPHDAARPCYRHLLVCDAGGGDVAPLCEGLESDPARAPSIEAGYVLALLAELTHHAAGPPVPPDASLLLRQVGYLAERLHERDRAKAAMDEIVNGLDRDREQARRGYETLEGHARAVESELASVGGARAQLERYASQLEGQLRDEKAAHAEERAELARQSSEYRRLEGYARQLEERCRGLAADAERNAAALAERDAAQAELRVARAQQEALRAHAENLSGIVERLSQSPANRLLRRLRGG